MNTNSKLKHLITLYPAITMETYTSLGKHGKVEFHARIRTIQKRGPYPDYEEETITWHRSKKSLHAAVRLAVASFMRYNKVSVKDLINGHNQSNKT